MTENGVIIGKRGSGRTQLAMYLVGQTKFDFILVFVASMDAQKQWEKKVPRMFIHMLHDPESLRGLIKRMTQRKKLPGRVLLVMDSLPMWIRPGTFGGNAGVMWGLLEQLYATVDMTITVLEMNVHRPDGKKDPYLIPKCLRRPFMKCYLSPTLSNSPVLKGLINPGDVQKKLAELRWRAPTTFVVFSCQGIEGYLLDPHLHVPKTLFSVRASSLMNNV